MGRASRRKWTNRAKRIDSVEKVEEALKIALHIRKKDKIRVALELKGVSYAEEPC